MPADFRQPTNRKLCLIKWCLGLAVLMFVGMFVLIRWNIGDTEARQKVIDNCTSTGPYAPSWAQQLQQYGLTDKSDQVITPYCHCMWDDALSKMSADDIRTFFKAPSEQQIRQLGGQEAMVKRHQQCLKNQQVRKTPAP